MKRICFAAGAVVALALGSMPALADNENTITGADVFSFCDGSKDNASPVLAAYCKAYIFGIAAVAESAEHHFICPPSGDTFHAYRYAVEQEIAGSPASLSLPGWKVVSAALVDSFPCDVGSPGVAGAAAGSAPASPAAPQAAAPEDDSPPVPGVEVTVTGTAGMGAIVQRYADAATAAFGCYDRNGFGAPACQAQAAAANEARNKWMAERAAK